MTLIHVFLKTVWDARNADSGYGTLFGLGTVFSSARSCWWPGSR